MKKSSTATFAAFIACAASVTISASASAQTFPNLPITPAQRATAQQVAQSGVPLSELAPNAPDSYTVKRGDTLWGISGMFLIHPWRWPELWGMNQDQIHNPHLIFPGQVLLLDRTGGRARLRVGRPVGESNDTLRMSPRVRVDGGDTGPIPAIPAKDIEPFLSRPLIVDEKTLATAPRIVATQEGRLYTGKGDKVYARGLPDTDKGSWQVFRPAKPLLDPDTQKVIGYEAQYLGEVQTQRSGDPATMAVVVSKEEIGVGDRLVETGKPEFVNYVPRAPQSDIEARVVSIYGGGVNSAAAGMIVSLNRGSAQGVERGHVLRVYRFGKVMKDETAPGQSFRLPDEAVGYLFVFRVFDNVSYGWIASSSNTVEVGDRVSSKLD